MAFPDEVAFKLSKGGHDKEHEVRHGGVLASEDQALFDQAPPHAFAGVVLDGSRQAIEVAGRPVCRAQWRANRSSSVSCGLAVSLPEAMSVNTGSGTYLTGRGLEARWLDMHTDRGNGNGRRGSASANSG